MAYDAAQKNKSTKRAKTPFGLVYLRHWLQSKSVTPNQRSISRAYCLASSRTSLRVHSSSSSSDFLSLCWIQSKKSLHIWFHIPPLFPPLCIHEWNQSGTSITQWSISIPIFLNASRSCCGKIWCKKRRLAKLHHWVARIEPVAVCLASSKAIW